MKMKNDYSDERLSLIFGEAMAHEPSSAETLAAWRAFEKKHTPRTKVIAFVAAAMAVAASLLWFFFATWQDVGIPSQSPLELYSERTSPTQVEHTLHGGICKVSTPAATTTLLTLADGTRVTLNANSTITYPQSFSEASERIVHLKGEAHFEVTKDPHHPFIVEAGEMQTKVLGTVFDVKAYRSDAPRVTLMDGKVSVSNRSTSVNISPGQTATLRSAQIIISKSPSDESTTSWLHGEFDMDQVSLAEAIGDIGAWYNKTVLFLSKKNMDKQIHFRFSRKASLAQVLTALNELGVAKLEMKSDKIIVE